MSKQIKQDYGNTINKFTKNINSIINLKKITNQEFYNDINNLKSKKLGFRKFRNKYIELFDNTYAKYKSKESFLGSYRRNINPKYYNQSKSKDVIRTNQELRVKTLIEPKIQKKILKKFKTTKVSKSITTSKKEYKEKIGYLGFARFEVSRLTEVWNLNKVIVNKLIGFSEIQFRICYDLIDDNGNIIYSNQWITIRSNISKVLRILELYDYAFEKFVDYVAKLEQSKLFIKLKKVCTYILREAY